MSGFIFLLIIACPLMMFFMMRGMHGGHGNNADGGHVHGQDAGFGHDHAGTDANTSLHELRRQREQLEREIEEREAEEHTPIGGDWR